MKKNIIKKILLLLFGLIIFGLVLYFNKKLPWQSLLTVNIYYLVLTFLLSFIMYGLFSYRWGLIVNYIQKDKVMSFFEYLFHYTFSFLVGSFTIQEPASFTTRVASLKISRKISLFKAANATLIERIFDLLNLILIVVPSILFFLKIINLSLGLTLMVAAIALFIISIAATNKDVSHLLALFHKLLIKIIEKSPFLKKKVDTQKLLEETESISFSKSFAIKIVLISFLKFLSVSLRYYLIFKTFNISIPLEVIILSTPIAQLTVFLSFTPGGLGIFEAGWFIILKMIALSPGDINTFLIGQRALTLLFTPIIALITYIFIIITKENRTIKPTSDS